MRSPVLLAGCGLLLAGCAVSTESAPAPVTSAAAVTPAPVPVTPSETVIEDPACPPARRVAALARVSVAGVPRCAEGWVAATGGSGEVSVRVLLRRDGFDFVVAQVVPQSRPCPAALPAALRTPARCP